jgi:hypothetical protein
MPGTWWTDDLEGYVSNEQSLGDPEVSLNVATSIKSPLEDLQKTEYKGTIHDLARFIMNDEAPEYRLLTLTKRYISLPEGPASNTTHPLHYGLYEIFHTPYHSDVFNIIDAYWTLRLLRQSVESNALARHAAKLPISASLADKISITIEGRHLLVSFERVITQNLPREVVNIRRRMDESDVIFMKDHANFFQGAEYILNLRNFLLEGAAERLFAVFYEKS